jgi:WD40 repeat protein
LLASVRHAEAVSSDGIVRAWDSRTGQADVLRGHGGMVTVVTSLRDGRVTSALVDGTVRVWDPRTGEKELPLVYSVSSSVRSLTVDPIRWGLTAGLADGRIMTLAIEPEASRERANRTGSGSPP